MVEQEQKTEDNLTPEEVAELQKFLGVGGAPSPDEKHTVHKFLHEVATSLDTTKTGFLLDEEVGNPKNPVRTFKGISLICEDIIGNDFFTNHFLKEAEIVTSTSLSRRAKLLELAVINKRQIEDVTKHKKQNKGWFKKKDESGEQT